MVPRSLVSAEGSRVCSSAIYSKPLLTLQQMAKAHSCNAQLTFYLGEGRSCMLLLLPRDLVVTKLIRRKAGHQTAWWWRNLGTSHLTLILQRKI
jgi:hypothetical protein